MKKEVWGGLSDDNKKELSNLTVLNEIYNKAIFAGMAPDWNYYMTETLDADKFIDLLKKLNVRFVKEEEDLILDDEDGNGVYDIADYIHDQINKNKSDLSIESAKMGEESLETFLDNFRQSHDLEDTLIEYLNEKPNMKKDFVMFCVKKFQESDNE